MAGLDKILGEIRAESEAIVKDILGKAESEANAIKAEAEHTASEAAARAQRESTHRLSDQMSRTQSAAALLKRQMLLETKQELIGNTLAMAKEKLLGLPDKDYFDMIVKIVKKAALKGDGQMLFNEKDLKRLPSGFESMIKSACEGKGGTLTVSKETRDIDGGCVLVYEGIEQNCSISSLFDTNGEALQDKIQELLFQD